MGFLSYPYLHAIALNLEVHICHMHMLLRGLCLLSFFFFQTPIENEKFFSMLDGVLFHVSSLILNS